MKNIKFDWDDILIEPAIISDIESRKEINIEYNPLIVSPMDTVVDENNAHLFLEKGYTVCLPRGIKYSSTLSECFFSYSLSTIEEMIDKDEVEAGYVLIDIANGHMRKLIEVSRKFKEKYPYKILMVGNIANPQTLIYLNDSGADLVRIGIGNGGGCTTSQNGSIGAAMGSLIEECATIKKDNHLNIKLIADGGFKEYANIIKSLAVGSDYVMLGSMLNKTLESCGDNYIKDGTFIKITKEEAQNNFEKGIDIYKHFRGMSTKEVQRKWGKEKLTTSEGVVRKNKVEYTLEGWTENFNDYLKSAMSYTNSRILGDFIGKVHYNFISQNALNRFRK